MRSHMVWFEILGQHTDSLHGFYSELLGWQFDTRQHPSPARGAPVANGTPFPRARVRTPAAPPWWVTFYVHVPDLDAAISWAARCPGASHGTIEVRPIWPM